MAVKGLSYYFPETCLQHGRHEKCPRYARNKISFVAVHYSSLGQCDDIRFAAIAMRSSEDVRCISERDAGLSAAAAAASQLRIDCIGRQSRDIVSVQCTLPAVIT